MTPVLAPFTSPPRREKHLRNGLRASATVHLRAIERAAQASIPAEELWTGLEAFARQARAAIEARWGERG